MCHSHHSLWFLATGHILKEQAWTYFSPPSGKSCVNIVTVDHFLGKQQSQGGAADSFIFCNQPGEVRCKVDHV